MFTANKGCTVFKVLLKYEMMFDVTDDKAFTNVTVSLYLSEPPDSLCFYVLYRDAQFATDSLRA